MKVLLSLLLLSALAAAVTPLQAEANQCSNATVAGRWGYSYTGTIFTQNGPLPAASVGRFHQDAAGNISGSQTPTVAGQAGVGEITGTIIVNLVCDPFSRYFARYGNPKSSPMNKKQTTQNSMASVNQRIGSALPGWFVPSRLHSPAACRYQTRGDY